MTDKNITEIAAEVGLLLQIDRLRHNIDTSIDMKAIANVPDYIAGVFRNANAVSGELTPAQAYDLINKRVSRVEAQLYLMRLELENRYNRDPAKIFADPLAISAYGERMEAISALEKDFGFDAEILASGWYPMEYTSETTFRWMRPQADAADRARPSVAAIPHLGAVDQTIEIKGRALRDEQFDAFEITAAGQKATITRHADRAFTATLALSGAQIGHSNYLPIEFNLGSFLRPNEQDKRLLGVHVSRFRCRPGLSAAAQEARG